MRFLYLIIGFIWGLSAAYAAEPQMTLLEVTGKGVVSVPAQKASIVFGVRAENESANTAINNVAKAQLRMMGAFHADGIDKKNIISDHVRVDVSYRDKNQIKYVATLEVKVYDQQPNNIGKVLDLGFANGATSIDNIEFSAKGLEEAQLLAYDLAVENAHEKAKRMATAAGLSIHSVKNIKEGGDHSGGQPPFMARSMAMADAVPSSISQVDFSGQALRKTASVHMSFWLTGDAQ